MIYTFAVLQNPLKAVPDTSSDFGHYFGGELDPSFGLDSPRFARILTLDLTDPLLSFLRFEEIKEVPLLMDFEGGWISYTLSASGPVRVHGLTESKSDSLLCDEPLPKSSFRLEKILYEEYRAAIFAQNVFHDYLTPDDRAILDRLGESYTQIGGHHSRAPGYQPYCGNPDCEGHGTQVTMPLATISQEPAGDVSLAFLPYDPAIEFSFCQNCHTIAGSIVAD